MLRDLGTPEERCSIFFGTETRQEFKKIWVAEGPWKNLPPFNLWTTLSEKIKDWLEQEGMGRKTNYCKEKRFKWPCLRWFDGS